MRPLRYLSLGLQGNASKPFLLLFVYADVAKLVDVPDLGSGAARRVGSSPSIRTKPSEPCRGSELVVQPFKPLF